MVSMQQIVVKITGQDNLSSKLANIAKSIKQVSQSSKQLGSSFGASVKQMERLSKAASININNTLKQIDKNKFKGVSSIILVLA